MLNFEKVLEEIGEFGNYQKYAIILLQFVILMVSPSYQMGSVFYAIKPKYSCAINNKNQSSDWCSEFTGQSSCDLNHQEDTCVSNEVEYCHSTDSMSSSIVDDFGLFCERKSLIPLSTTIFMFGVCLGSFSLQSLADFIGRLRCSLLYVIILSATNFAMSYSTSFPMWMSLRFITGLFTSSAYGVTYTYVLELLTERRRMLLGVINSITFGIGTMYLSLLAYIFNDWRSLARAIAITPVIPVIISFFTLVESPRWLLNKNKEAEANKAIKRIAKFNRKEVTNQMLELCKNMDENKDEEDFQEETIKEFLKPRICLMTCANCWLWFALCVIYYGISLSSTSLAGNPFLNNALSGLAESASGIFTIMIINRISRRSYVFYCMSIAGLTLIVLSSLTAQYPEDEYSWMKFITLGLNNFGKLVVCMVWTMAFVYVGEIYPTLWRSTGSGLASGAARIGSMIAPQLVFTNPALRWLPGMIMGFIGLTGGLAARLLPNSNGRPQPETFAAVNKMYEDKPLFSIF